MEGTASTIQGMVNMDAYLISCHSIGLRADWVQDGCPIGVVCSFCDSIHPEAFIEQLRAGEFICGFMWEGGPVPLYAYVGGYRFFAIHLQDMSAEWLHAHAMEIFKATGVLFYWDREEFLCDAVAEGVRLGKGSAYTLTPEQIEAASRTNDSFYYFGERK